MDLSSTTTLSATRRSMRNPRVQLLAFVGHGEFNLPSEGNPLSRQLPCEAYFVRRFKQAWPEFPVYFDRRSDDRVGDFTMNEVDRSHANSPV